jgi:hypothetical protein
MKEGDGVLIYFLKLQRLALQKIIIRGKRMRFRKQKKKSPQLKCL